MGLLAMTFTVVVGECVVPSFGRVIVLEGESARVPVQLISSVPLTNLSMTVEARPARLTNLWVEPLPSMATQICAAALTPALSHPMGEGEAYDLSLTTCSNQFLIGTQQVAWLNFTATTNGPSAFVTLRLGNTVGLQPDGTPVRNFAPQSGRVVVIGEEPLLEAGFGTNYQLSLMLYAKPEFGYDLLWSTGTSSGGPWTTRLPVTMSNLFQEITVPLGLPQQFYRARRQ